MASSILTSWTLLLWNTLKDKGYDPLKTFEKAGADPKKLGDGQARYMVSVMPKLWQVAIEQSGDPDIGIEAGKNWTPTTFHALGFAWLASNSLLDALNRLIRYSDVVHNSALLQIEKHNDYYKLSITTTEPEHFHSASIDAVTSALIQMCRLLLGENFKPLAIHLTRPSRDSQIFENFSGIEINYQQDNNFMLIDSYIMEKELSTGNSSLVMVSEQAARDYLQTLKKDDVLSAVKGTVVELLPSGQLSESRIAEHLGLNVRTMQRRLKERGQSFKTIINETRKELVQSLIRDSSISLTEIAYLLGFSDQANFSRAFKRWNDCSPSEFRKNIEQKKNDS